MLRQYKAQSSECSAADLDVGLDLYAQFLQVLYNRAINGTSQVGVLIRNDTSLVSYTVVDVLGCLSEFKVRDY